MIRIRSILEVFMIAWRSKAKRYLVLVQTTSTEDTNKLIIFDDYQSAKKEQIRIMRDGDNIDTVRIAMELSVMELKCEAKKEKPC